MRKKSHCLDCKFWVARKISIYACGHEAGVGIDSVPSTHLLTEVKIPKLGENNEELSFIVTRYNTNVVVDKKNRIFMWGEGSNNFKLRSPEEFYRFQNKKIQILQVELGKRHGIIRTNEDKGSIYGWGDGTYGELGITENLPIEAPIRIPFFEDKKIKKVSVGARHTLALDYEGKIYAMGDNSEDQCAISGRRANEPEIILMDFKAVDIFAGDSHNIALSDDQGVYSWGGSTINTSWT